MVNTSNFSLLFHFSTTNGKRLFTSSIERIMLETLTKESQQLLYINGLIKIHQRQFCDDEIDRIVINVRMHAFSAFKNYILQKWFWNNRAFEKKEREKNQKRIDSNLRHNSMRNKVHKGRSTRIAFLAPFNLSTSRNKWKWSSVNRARGLSTRRASSRFELQYFVPVPRRYLDPSCTRIKIRGEKKGFHSGCTSTKTTILPPPPPLLEGRSPVEG